MDIQSRHKGKNQDKTEGDEEGDRGDHGADKMGGEAEAGNVATKAGEGEVHQQAGVMGTAGDPGVDAGDPTGD